MNQDCKFCEFIPTGVSKIINDNNGKGQQLINVNDMPKFHTEKIELSSPIEPCTNISKDLATLICNDTIANNKQMGHPSLLNNNNFYLKGKKYIILKTNLPKNLKLGTSQALSNNIKFINLTKNASEKTVPLNSSRSNINLIPLAINNGNLISPLPIYLTYIPNQQNVNNVIKIPYTKTGTSSPCLLSYMPFKFNGAFSNNLAHIEPKHPKKRQIKKSGEIKRRNCVKPKISNTTTILKPKSFAKKIETNFKSQHIVEPYFNLPKALSTNFLTEKYHWLLEDYLEKIDIDGMKETHATALDICTRFKAGQPIITPYLLKQNYVFAKKAKDIFYGCGKLNQPKLCMFRISLSPSVNTPHIQSTLKPYQEFCFKRVLPYTNLCLDHIGADPNQQLFERCNARFSSDIQCSMPTFDLLNPVPLCWQHARKKAFHDKCIHTAANRRGGARVDYTNTNKFTSSNHRTTRRTAKLALLANKTDQLHIEHTGKKNDIPFYENGRASSLYQPKLFIQTRNNIHFSVENMAPVHPPNSNFTTGINQILLTTAKIKKPAVKYSLPTGKNPPTNHLLNVNHDHSINVCPTIITPTLGNGAWKSNRPINISNLTTDYPKSKRLKRTRHSSNTLSTVPDTDELGIIDKHLNVTPLSVKRRRTKSTATKNNPEQRKKKALKNGVKLSTSCAENNIPNSTPKNNDLNSTILSAYKTITSNLRNLTNLNKLLGIDDNENSSPSKLPNCYLNPYNINTNFMNNSAVQTELSLSNNIHLDRSGRVFFNQNLPPSLYNSQLHQKNILAPNRDPFMGTTCFDISPKVNQSLQQHKSIMASNINLIDLYAQNSSFTQGSSYQTLGLGSENILSNSLIISPTKRSIVAGISTSSPFTMTNVDKFMNNVSHSKQDVWAIDDLIATNNNAHEVYPQFVQSSCCNVPNAKCIDDRNKTSHTTGFSTDLNYYNVTSSSYNFKHDTLISPIPQLTPSNAYQNNYSSFLLSPLLSPLRSNGLPTAVDNLNNIYFDNNTSSLLNALNYSVAGNINNNNPNLNYSSFEGPSYLSSLGSTSAITPSSRDYDISQQTKPTSTSTFCDNFHLTSPSKSNHPNNNIFLNNLLATNGLKLSLALQHNLLSNSAIKSESFFQEMAQLQKTGILSNSLNSYVDGYLPPNHHPTNTSFLSNFSSNSHALFNGTAALSASLFSNESLPQNDVLSRDLEPTTKLHYSNTSFLSSDLPNCNQELLGSHYGLAATRDEDNLIMEEALADISRDLSAFVPDATESEIIKQIQDNLMKDFIT